MRLTNVFHARATHTSRDFQGTWSLERGYKGRRPLGSKYSYRGNAVPAPLAKGESPFANPYFAPVSRAWCARYGIFKGHCPLNGDFKGRRPLGSKYSYRGNVVPAPMAKGIFPFANPCSAPRAARRASAQVVLRSEGDEPERQPSGTYALQTLSHAKQGFVLKA